PAAPEIEDPDERRGCDGQHEQPVVRARPQPAATQGLQHEPCKRPAAQRARPARLQRSHIARPLNRDEQSNGPRRGLLSEPVSGATNAAGDRARLRGSSNRAIRTKSSGAEPTLMMSPAVTGARPPRINPAMAVKNRAKYRVPP